MLDAVCQETQKNLKLKHERNERLIELFDDQSLSASQKLVMSSKLTSKIGKDKKKDLVEPEVLEDQINLIKKDLDYLTDNKALVPERMNLLMSFK